MQKKITGTKGTPYAQKLFFGWVIVGEVCLGNVHKPNNINVNKTKVLKGGRGTVFELCKNKLYVKEHYDSDRMFKTRSDDYQIFRKIRYALLWKTEPF